MGNTLTIVVPFPPGGATSFIAGALASALTKSTGMKIDVEAHTGNFGTRAMQQLLDRPSGAVIMVGSVNTNSIGPVLHREDFPFDYSSSIVPVCRLADYNGILAGQKGTVVLPLAEFIEHLKKTKGRIVYGTDFLGTNIDIDMVKIAKATNVKMAYRVADGALALLDELEHQKIDMTILNVGTMRREFGRYKALAAISPKERIDFIPDTPTMAEAGFPGIGVNHWLGVFASRKTPKSVLNTLFSMVVEAMRDKNTREQIEKTGAKVAISTSMSEFAAEIEAEMAEWEILKPQILATEKIE